MPRPRPWPPFPMDSPPPTRDRSCARASPRSTPFATAGAIAGQANGGRPGHWRPGSFGDSVRRQNGLPHRLPLTCGKDKEPLAKQLGAHSYIDSQAGDPAKALQAVGVLRPASSWPRQRMRKAMAAVLGGLAVDGKLIVIGASSEPLEVNTIPMLMRRQSIAGWPSACIDRFVGYPGLLRHDRSAVHE